jgi:hypothetical protein
MSIVFQKADSTQYTENQRADFGVRVVQALYEYVYAVFVGQYVISAFLNVYSSQTDTEFSLTSTGDPMLTVLFMSDLMHETSVKCTGFCLKYEFIVFKTLSIASNPLSSMNDAMKLIENSACSEN